MHVVTFFMVSRLIRQINLFVSPINFSRSHEKQGAIGNHCIHYTSRRDKRLHAFFANWPHHLDRIAVERFRAEPQQTLASASKGTTPFSEFSTHTVSIEKLAMPNVKATIAYNRKSPTLSLASFFTGRTSGFPNFALIP